MTTEEIRQKAIECGGNFGTMCASNRCADGCPYTGLERCSAVYAYEHGFADGVEEGIREFAEWIEHNFNDVSCLYADCEGRDCFDAEKALASYEKEQLKGALT